MGHRRNWRTAPFDGAQDRLRDAAKRRRLLRATGKVLVILNLMTPKPFVLRLSKHAGGGLGDA